jgi:hypothetical protein
MCWKKVAVCGLSMTISDMYPLSASARSGFVKLASFCKKMRSARARGFTVEKGKGLAEAIFRRLWPLAGSPTLPFGLFGLFQSLALAQSHARAASVFVHLDPKTEPVDHQATRDGAYIF